LSKLAVSYVVKFFAIPTAHVVIVFEQITGLLLHANLQQSCLGPIFAEHNSVKHY
jgi:hypothetical protein